MEMMLMFRMMFMLREQPTPILMRSGDGSGFDFPFSAGSKTARYALSQSKRVLSPLSPPL
jgi:hypothetical protein